MVEYENMNYTQMRIARAAEKLKVAEAYGNPRMIRDARIEHFISLENWKYELKISEDISHEKKIS